MGKILKPAVFLDRDGTINVEKNYLYRIEEFEYKPGVIEGLKKLDDMGFILVIITNQSGIARGIYTEEDFRKLNGWMLVDLEDKGVKISGVYHCPHHPRGRVPEYAVRCRCRKPSTGLFWRAQKELQIDMDKSFAIGDRLRDLTVCKESGVQGVLLVDGSEMSYQDGICRCRTFGGAVEWIERQKNIYMRKEESFRSI